MQNSLQGGGEGGHITERAGEETHHTEGARAKREHSQATTGSQNHRRKAWLFVKRQAAARVKKYVRFELMF